MTTQTYKPRVCEQVKIILMNKNIGTDFKVLEACKFPGFKETKTKTMRDASVLFSQHPRA